MESPETQLVNKRQAAKYLSISVASLQRLMGRELPYVRIGRLARFRIADLADFIEQRRVQPGAAA